MLDALARSIAETAADALGKLVWPTGAKISDEQIGLYLWHERGFRDHATLVSLINHTRVVVDQREVETVGTVSCQPEPKPPEVRATVARPRPVQLTFDWMAA